MAKTDPAASAPAPEPARAPAGERSTAQLIADLPRLVVGLLQDELQSLKKEITARLARAGIGAGLIAGAAFVGFFALAVFIAAAIIGLSLVLPGWLAALIVFAGLLIIAVIVVLVGARTLRGDKSDNDSDDIQGRSGTSVTSATPGRPHTTGANDGR